MNILYCGDSNTEKGIFLSLLSLMKQVGEALHVYVLTMEWEQGDRHYYPISGTFIRSVEQYMQRVNPEHTVRLFDVTELFAACIPAPNMDTRFTPCCMLRLFADQVPEIPERVLYLDNDVLCRDGITEFYDQNLDGCEFVGVLDYYGSWFFRNQFWKRDYVNSGVLLLNMAEIKRTGLFEKCRDRCRDQKMFMPDQSSLNKLATSKRLADRRYNEQRRLHKNTALQHFTTSFRLFPWLHTVTVKPWDFERVHEVLKIHEYDSLFREFQEGGIPITENER